MFFLQYPHLKEDQYINIINICPPHPISKAFKGNI